MARISLLLSLALVLAIVSVSAHPPSHKKTKKTSCPPTLSKIQAYPNTEISSFVQKQVESAPDNIRFKILFAVCKSYTDFLGTFKFAPSSKKQFQTDLRAKFVLSTKAFLAAQAYVGVKDGISFTLANSYGVMAERYIALLDKINKISKKHSFKANAKISLSDRAEIEKIIIQLKGAIRVFAKLSGQCSKKFAGSMHMPPHAGGIGGLSVKHGFAYANKLIGLGGEVAHAGANAKFGAHAGANAKVGAHAGANAKVGAHAGAKAKVGAHAKGKVGAKGEAKVGGSLGGFFGFGGKAQFDAAGKAHVGGGNGFRPLSKPSKKHLD